MNAHPCVPLLIEAAGKAHRLERHQIDLPSLIFRHPNCLPIEGADALLPVCLRLPAALGSLDLLLCRRAET